MNAALSQQSEPRWTPPSWRWVCASFLILHSSFFILHSAAALNATTNGLVTKSPATNAPAAPEPPPVTARDFFNAGTRLLQGGKLREAESYLQTALARQDDRFQPAALFNLGHTRFAQGVEELKKAPDARKTAERTRAAAGQGAAALQDADSALASKDVQRMVEAYRQGRGARKELNAALKAVRAAMEAHASVLLKWQRASSDFKGAAELNPANPDAQHNADVVNRHIARLIDQVREMQQAMAAAAQAKQQLGEKLKQLRGQIPDEDAPPGAAGEEEDEEEDMPNGLQPGMQEGASKPGDEMKMSPEEAGDLLNGYRLDEGRRLPMGGDQEGKPRDPNRPTW
jgi:tetratricopeptide (TPR) repeat protein